VTCPHCNCCFNQQHKQVAKLQKAVDQMRGQRDSLRQQVKARKAANLLLGMHNGQISGQVNGQTNGSRNGRADSPVSSSSDSNSSNRYVTLLTNLYSVGVTKAVSYSAL
jgi:hypothetical protein